MANLITLARIGLIVPFCFAFLANASWNMNVALVIFAIASLTDFLDGYVARARNEVSALGKAIDPLADKLLIAAALILLTRNGIIYGANVLAVIAIILRELTVSGMREALSGQSTLPVTGLAKWKTALQILAVGTLLASAPSGLIGSALNPLAVGILWTAALLTVWTGGQYVYLASKILRKRATE